MESSRSRRRRHGTLAQSSCADHELFRRAFRQLWTRHGERYRKACAENPAAGRRNDGYSVAGYDQCKFQRREENKPSQGQPGQWAKALPITYPHSTVKSSCNFVVSFKARAAPKNLGQPELTDCALHVLNLALHRGGGSNPLRRFSADTAYHVRMGQCLRRRSVTTSGHGRR